MLASDSLVDSHGNAITPSQIKSAMRINVAAGSFGMLFIAMTVQMPLSMFLEAAGCSGLVIGLLNTVRMLAITAQVPAAFITERLASRKRFWAISALSSRVMWFPIALLTWYWEPGLTWIPVAVIVLAGVSEFVVNASAAPWFSWMAELIPNNIAGRFWGIRQAIVTVASLSGIALSGVILDYFRSHGVDGSNTARPDGFAILFGIAAVCGVLDIVIHYKVHEPRPVPTPQTVGAWKRILAPLRDVDFRRFTLALAVWTFAVSMVAPFGIVHFKRDFPVTYSQVALLPVLFAVGTAVSAVLWGHLSDRFGPRILCAFLIAASPFSLFPWFFVDTSFLTFHLPFLGPWSVPQVLVNQGIATFFIGAFFSGVAAPCQMRLLSVLSPASGRTMAMAVHWSVVGLVASGGSFVGGWLMDYFTANPPFPAFPNGTTFSGLHVLIAGFTLVVWGVAVPLVLGVRASVDRISVKDIARAVFYGRGKAKLVD